MKKNYLLFLIFFLTIQSVFADIAIKTDQHIYNLGNKIRVSTSLMEDKNFEGLFKLTLSCGNYELIYFLTPISLEANFRNAFSVPDLIVTPSMLGNCTIIGSITTNDNLLIEEKESNRFGITNQLSIIPIKTKMIALPDDIINIVGIINEAFGNNILKASTKIMFDNNSYLVDALDGKFNLTLEIPKNIKSGEHDIVISAFDAKNNVGESLTELDITPVPSYIRLDVTETKLLPGSTIEILAALYDQADDLINASLDLELTSPKAYNIFRKVVQSNERLSYEFSQYAEPGIYVLVSNYKNLLTQSLINITTIKEVKVKYENETVLVENIGNTPFEDELTFILESGTKKFPINKKIKVEPGKIISIDLSKEVPQGIYDVGVAMKESLKAVNERLNESLRGLLQQESLLASDVTIHDNRPIYRRLSSAFYLLSGFLIGTGGLLTKNPLIAPSVLIIILIIIIIRYGRKPIMRLIKGKKDDEDKKE